MTTPSREETIARADGSPILYVFGHPAHEVGTRNIKVLMFREDLKIWVLAGLDVSADKTLRISPPHEGSAYCFSLDAHGQYQFEEGGGERMARLESLSAGRIKMLAIEYEDYSKKFFGGH